MKFILTLLLASAVLLSQTGCESKSESAGIQKSEVIPVKTIGLSPESGKREIAVAGQFTTDDEVNLSFKITGIVQSILVKEGDPVRKGQLLATLDQTEINAQVQQAQMAYEKAKRDHQRVMNLYTDSVATLEQLQNGETALEISRQQLNAATFNKNYTEIHAPKDGYVLKKVANVGQLISSGTTVLQTNGARAENWILRVGVSDKEWAAINIGDSARVEVDAVPGKLLKGNVSRKSQGVDRESGSFVVDIKLHEKVEGIASGMFGKAIISSTTGNETDQLVWAIPYDALLDGDGRSGFVFVTNDGKTAKRVKVAVSAIEEDRVLINGGLENAKALIVAGSAYLTDNSPIKIIE